MALYIADRVDETVLYLGGRNVISCTYSALSLSGTTPRHLWWPTTDRYTHKHSLSEHTYIHTYTLNEQIVSYMCTYVHTHVCNISQLRM